MRPASRAPTEKPGREPEFPADTATSPANGTRLWRRLAFALGLVAVACALASPFLPVVQDTARIVWPAGGDTTQVNAPLSGYWAQDLRMEIPCRTVHSVDDRTAGDALLLSTVPAARLGNGAGMQLRVDDGVLTAYNRGEQVVRQPLPPTGCAVRFDSDALGTSLSVGGTTVFQQDGDVRPRIIGVYTTIDGDQDPIDGLAVSITPDTRYQSSPTALKTGVWVLGVVAFIGCLVAVNRLDRGYARRAPRWAPVGWWRLTGRDVTVIGALGAWVFIGPVTSDDGYILSMARVTEEAGFLANYHRWFGVAEAPFGWFYHVYQAMAHVSVVAPWIRLPSFLLGVLSWMLISREVMPRLGKAVRSSRAAGWAAAVVFLVWWMPYNNGTRPEPVAAVGSLLAICAVERALVTRRLLPVCLGVLTAAFTLAATPTGLLAVAPFLVAARPLFHLLRQRAREAGWTWVLAPIIASGTLVLFVVFADQTYATVAEATRLRNEVGPSLSWFQELLRYQQLFSDTVDGSASRRFPVLLLLLCVGTCLVVLLRRGRIPGAALGPSRRLIGTVAVFFVLMALTPTKWTHHFGAFAAVGAAMAALTALATSSSVLRSKRNRAAFLSGLLVVAALAATGPNAYWYVSRMGVPWWNMPPQLFGVRLSTLLLLVAVVAAIVAFLENIRAQSPGFPPHLPERRGRALWRGSLAFVVVCGLVATAEFGSMAKAIHKQRDSYSLGADNIEHLVGHSCGLADDVMVERDPVASVLTPLPANQQRTAERDRDREPGGLPSAAEGTGPTQAGFHTRPLGTGDPLSDPPHGFTPSTVPMWSSYNETANPTGRLRTSWSGLGSRPEGGQVVVAVFSPPGKATSADVEFGARSPDGIEVVDSLPVLLPGGGTGGWVDVRFDLAQVPEDARMVRVTATDDDLTEDGWVAVTAPRLPTFTTLTDRVGDQPVYMDWPTSFVFPCLNPVKVRDGIVDVPAYHITASSLATEGQWAESPAGGPNGILDELAAQPEVPSYLRAGEGQPWGTLEQVEPFTEGAAPTIVRGEAVRPGWWSPGPGPQQPDGEQPTR
ncbi:arabinosyltransferase domain-containing protein [Prauserella cavernicola]|uniref:Arabinosyltransferase domain-containing protein n=1 Tax=Prauserella cavernicola TaxID=2800127 RepID=A0A934QVE5_9PSEU|nr:arabinosyltransferase domain-containing protein [Prauserella cavernicola]MBK1786932.1 arabinosyltransferase domain-containing protein [Prauserella cavernicola]